LFGNHTINCLASTSRVRIGHGLEPPADLCFVLFARTIKSLECNLPLALSLQQVKFQVQHPRWRVCSNVTLTPPITVHTLRNTHILRMQVLRLAGGFSDQIPGPCFACAHNVGQCKTLICLLSRSARSSFAPEVYVLIRFLYKTAQSQFIGLLSFSSDLFGLVFHLRLASHPTKTA